MQDTDADPYLLYLAFTAPHDPRTPPVNFARDGADVSLPPAYMPTHPFDNGEVRVRDEMREVIPRPPDAVRQHIADYYGMIAHMDAAIGDVLQTLAATGRLDNTIVIYTADHGLGLGNHGLMGKQNLYEHSIGIPLIMAGSDIPVARKSAELVWHVDTHATVLALAGLQPAAQCAGIDLRGHMEHPDEPVRKTYAAAYRSSQRLIRAARYKLIRYYTDPAVPPDCETPTPGSVTEQLFDLRTDPDELINRAFQPDLMPMRDHLREALAEWQRDLWRGSKRSARASWL